MIGKGYPQVFHVTDVAIPEEEVQAKGFGNHQGHVFLAPRGELLLMFRIQDCMWRFFHCARDTATSQPSSEAESMREKFGRLLPTAEVMENAHFGEEACFQVSCKLADTFQRGRLFLVGDAAHTHSPAGGQGMNTGIQDALNLSWKIAAVLKGESSEQWLESYELERRPVAEWVLRTSDAAFYTVTGAGSGDADSVKSRMRSLLRWLVMAGIVLALRVLPSRMLPPPFILDCLYGLSIAYRSSGTVASADAPCPWWRTNRVRAGDRLPDLPCLALFPSNRHRFMKMSLLQIMHPFSTSHQIVLISWRMPQRAALQTAVDTFISCGVPSRVWLYVTTLPRAWPNEISAVQPHEPDLPVTLLTPDPAVSMVGGVLSLSALLQPTGATSKYAGWLMVRPDGYISAVHHDDAQQLWDPSEVTKMLHNLEGTYGMLKPTMQSISLRDDGESIR
eukprot:gene5210-6335_t